MIALGWLQLWKKKARFAAALGGVMFAVILIFMQLGFLEAMFESAARYPAKLRYDIALLSPKSQSFTFPQRFSRRRIYQALAVEGVESVSPVYMEFATLRNPWAFNTRDIFVVGFDLSDPIFDQPAVVNNLHLLSQRDVVLFDEFSRPDWGPIAQTIRSGQHVFAEVNNRELEFAGLFPLGTSFRIDGTVLASDINFLRIFPNRPRGLIDLGLIHVKAGADVKRVSDAIRATLPNDVLVMTKPEFIHYERHYWDKAQPIGFILGLGALVGFLVGMVIVYQILFSDVSDHLPEYATLKAMGYSNGYLSRVVLQQAFILAMSGYVPAFLVILWLYATATEATRLPIHMTTERAIGVLTLTIGMCCVSGMSALRVVRRADPADVF